MSHAVLEFVRYCETHGWMPSFFSSTRVVLPQAQSLGYRYVQVAEDTVIDLPDLQFKGKAWQDVRTALNQAAKLGIDLRLGPLVEQPRGIQTQVRAISSEWVEDKGLPEMGFTLGGVDEAMDPHVHVGLAVDGDATVHGVTSWMPVHAEGGGEPIGWTLDVMRRVPGAFRYSMEFLIASACLAYRDQGAAVVSLSGAPLARSSAVGDDRLDRGTLDVFLDRLGGALEPYYGFRSLHAFKAKFQPRIEPLYLVFPGETDLPRIGIALSRAYLPDAGITAFFSLALEVRAACLPRGLSPGPAPPLRRSAMPSPAPMRGGFGPSCAGRYSGRTRLAQVGNHQGVTRRSIARLGSPNGSNPE